MPGCAAADSHLADTASVGFPTLLAAGGRLDRRKPATVAETLHLGVGDILRVSLLTKTRDLVPFSFRVVGIDAAPGEFFAVLSPGMPSH